MMSVQNNNIYLLTWHASRILTLHHYRIIILDRNISKLIINAGFDVLKLIATLLVGQIHINCIKITTFITFQKIKCDKLVNLYEISFYEFLR